MAWGYISTELFSGMSLIAGLFWVCIRSLLTLVCTSAPLTMFSGMSSIVGLFWLCIRSRLTLVRTSGRWICSRRRVVCFRSRCLPTRGTGGPG
jgi:hypothetical protein